MKQFLYLDSDIIMSIIAQAEKGYIVQTSEESSNSLNKSKENSGALSIGLKGSGGLWNLIQTDAGLDINSEIRNDRIEQTSFRSIKRKYSMMQPLI